MAVAPAAKPRQVLVTSFATTNPKGFGLMQRDRQWSSYEDVEVRYERRPSAWVRPCTLGPRPCGTGATAHARRNPRQRGCLLGAPAVARPGTPLEVSYELAWQGDEQQRPPSAWATQSRKGVGYTQQSAEALRTQVQYVVDFTGPALHDLKADAPVKAVVTSDANGRVLESGVYRNLPPASGA